MSEEVNYVDSEFSLSGTEKIDYKGILFKQIDYIRFLRTQDMGEFTIINLKLLVDKDELYLKWFNNSSMYQNAIYSLKTLLINYNDDKFIKNLNTIDKKYDDNFKSLKKVLVLNAKRIKCTKQVFEKDLAELTSKFSFTQLTKKNEEIFEQCLLLMGRAKFIGGNDLITQKNG